MSKDGVGTAANVDVTPYKCRTFAGGQNARCPIWLLFSILATMAGYKRESDFVLLYAAQPSHLGYSGRLTNFYNDEAIGRTSDYNHLPTNRR
jgi:hypothetical protein